MRGTGLFPQWRCWYNVTAGWLLLEMIVVGSCETFWYPAGLLLGPWLG